MQHSLEALRLEHERSLTEIDRLSNRMTLIQDRLTRSQANGSDADANGGDDAAAPAPRLPVVKLHRDSVRARASDSDDEPIYEGEAARSSRKRPAIRIYETSRSALPDAPAPRRNLAVPASDGSPARTEASGDPQWQNGYPDPSSVNEKLPVTRTTPRAAATPRDDDDAGAVKRTPPAEAGSDAARGLVLFARAHEELGTGDYAGAERDFKQFLNRFPNHAAVDTALYFLGETYYARRKWDDAATQYLAVGARFPKSAKAADASLKAGLCYANLKDTAKARELLAEVLKHHPRSEAARQATIRLTELLR